MEGMAIWPLKRRRTALSIPLGLRHACGTHFNRSDWWRLKRAMPVARGQSLFLNYSCIPPAQSSWMDDMTSPDDQMTLLRWHNFLHLFHSSVPIFFLSGFGRPGDDIQGRHRDEGESGEHTLLDDRDVLL